MSTRARDTYCYTPLSHTSQIRILTLAPGCFEDPLVGELNIVDIEKAGHYEALSYVWGDPVRHSEFICSDKPIGLTASLAGALRRLRRHDQPRHIWADQVSINQDDEDERSKQVQLMNSIYKNATHVLVWLGEDFDEEAQNAFDLIHSLDRQLRDEKSREQFRITYTEDLHKQSAEVWNPLKHLTANPYVS